MARRSVGPHLRFAVFQKFSSRYKTMQYTVLPLDIAITNLRYCNHTPLYRWFIPSVLLEQEFGVPHRGSNQLQHRLFLSADTNSHPKKWSDWYAFRITNNGEEGVVYLYQRQRQRNRNQWIFTGTNNRLTKEFYYTLLIWAPLKNQDITYTLAQSCQRPNLNRIVRNYKRNYIDGKWRCIRCDRRLNRYRMASYLQIHHAYPLFCTNHS